MSIRERFNQRTAELDDSTMLYVLRVLENRSANPQDDDDDEDFWKNRVVPDISEFTPFIDTVNWKFNREEANER